MSASKPELAVPSCEGYDFCDARTGRDSSTEEPAAKVARTQRPEKREDADIQKEEEEVRPSVQDCGRHSSSVYRGIIPESPRRLGEQDTLRGAGQQVCTKGVD